MTEAEWLACEDAEKMSDYLFGKVSERKLLLSGYVCCCRIAQPPSAPKYLPPKAEVTRHPAEAESGGSLRHAHPRYGPAAERLDRRFK